MTFGGTTCPHAHPLPQIFGTPYPEAKSVYVFTLGSTHAKHDITL
jgi:hypothetical protein